MATLEKRNETYRIDFRCGGRRYRRSLKTTSERSANASLARLNDNLYRLELGTLVLPDGVDVATFLLSDGRVNGRLTARAPAIRTLKELCGLSLASIPEGSLEESTTEGMEIHARHLCRILGASTDLSDIGLNQLQVYVNRRSRQKGRGGRKVRPATIKKELVTLRWMWNWANRSELFSQKFLHIKELRFPKVAEKPPFQTMQEIERTIARGGLSEQAQAELWGSLFLTKDQIEKVLGHVEQASRHPFLHPMFAFAAFTGARRSEMLRSKIDEIDFDGGFVTIREKKRKRGRLTTRRTPLSPRLHAILADWLQRHPGGHYTFCLEPNVRRSRSKRSSFGPLTPSQAHTHFKRVLYGSKWNRLSGWHVFRHSFCSNCAAARLDQRTINAWVGHQTDEMVRRYRHLFPNKQQDDIRKVFGDE